MFKISKDTIDPKKVPKRILSTGAEIPAVGIGTFGSDRFTPEQVSNAVSGAAAVGYRHFDCASVYGNENLIGEVFKEILDSGEIKREELWITSKLWNDKHDPKDVIDQCKKSIKDLQCDYLDAYLIHWPFPNYHPPGCDVTSRSPDARPYIHEEYMATWAEMEKLVEMGLVKHIGTSNMTIPKMELVLRDARIKPSINEMELHPHFQQQEFFEYIINNGIVPVGFCPIGSPTRPDRDKTPTDTSDIDDPVIKEIAQNHGVHPAIICIKWAVQRGQVPIPFSIHEDQYRSNLECAVIDPLSDEEMEKISKIDKNSRLIKGHVFLWREGQTWEDLWDLDGKITK